jgi:molybdopterin-guanine dinucleotide biosynthesis protein A
MLKKTIEASSITAVILAGGQATRMGGANKGLQLFHGRPLIQHVLNRLKNQVSQIIINANADIDRFGEFGLPIWTDSGQSLGPLTGFLTGLIHCQTPYLLVVPCDVPLLPLNLVEHLSNAMLNNEADICLPISQLKKIASTEILVQPTFCLLKKGLADSLEKFLATGGRRIQEWTRMHKTVQVEFTDSMGENNLAFSNINTLAELVTLEQLTTQHITKDR